MYFQCNFRICICDIIVRLTIKRICRTHTSPNRVNGESSFANGTVERHFGKMESSLKEIQRRSDGQREIFGSAAGRNDTHTIRVYICTSIYNVSSGLGNVRTGTYMCDRSDERTKTIKANEVTATVTAIAAATVAAAAAVMAARKGCGAGYPPTPRDPGPR